MSCAHCGNPAASPSGPCSVCGRTTTSALPDVATGVLTPPVPGPSGTGGADETRLAEPGETRAYTGPSAGRTGGTAFGSNTGPLRVGENFGTRYHIIRPLGVGGMGAVYQAWDQELEVAVAVKVIRPDVAADPWMAQELERRFKRELLLARQVTHKNVVRIHDIGEIDGIKYITMPYVQGADLATLIKRDGRLPLGRALSIAKQVAAGLVAAHEAGVVHRDLKPPNIMVDAEGCAQIMDFGIARSTSGPPAGFAGTAAGAVIGTMEFMAPEQASGQPVDQRADIYAFGLILRDMLIGGRNAGDTTAVAELMSRMQHAPPSLRAMDASIPPAIDALVTRCLQPAAGDRYQTSADLLRDLERVADGGQTTVPSGTLTLPGPLPAPSTAPPQSKRRPALMIGAAVAALLVLGAAGYTFFARPRPVFHTTASGDVGSLAVLPFRNASGDASLDALGTSLSDLLSTDLGDSSRVRTIPTERLHQVLGDLQIDRRANLSPAQLSRIADLASAKSVLWGQFVKFGDEIRIDATLQDLTTRSTTPLKATAPNQAGLMAAVGQLAASVQESLAGGSSDVLNELKSTAWRPSTESFDALRLYNEGQQIERDGKHEEAVKQFQAAVAADSNFALAYAAMAQSYAGAGNTAQATQNARRAVSLGESLPPQEKYLIAAAFYRITNDSAKAIETYEKLLQVSPNNVAIEFQLASLYEQTGDLQKAQDLYQKIAQLDAKYVEGLIALGRVAIKRGDPQASLQPLNNALSLAISLNNDVARANVLQAIGIAYKRLGRPKEALKQYEESLSLKRSLGQKRGMAVSLTEIAQIHEQLGAPADALKSYNEALALQREIGDKPGMGTTLINMGALLNDSLGRPDDALPALRQALQIARDEGDRSMEALGVNNIGTAYLAKGEYSEAQTYFERALELREVTKVPREIADTLHNLGETLGKMGKYDQAVARYLRAVELRRTDGDKRGEAIEAYSIGGIFDVQGRYGAAVKSKGDALEAFRALGQKDVWFGEILSGYGYSLALSGRLDESSKALTEALDVARRIENEGLVAQVLRFQASRLTYAGDARGAAKLAEQSAQAASRASDRTLDVWARAEVAGAAASAKPNRSAAAALTTVARQADAQGLTYLSVLSSIRAAETLVKAGEPQQARADLDRALAQADTLGLRELPDPRRAGDGNHPPLRQGPAGPPALRCRAAADGRHETGRGKRSDPRPLRSQGALRRLRPVGEGGLSAAPSPV